MAGAGLNSSLLSLKIHFSTGRLSLVAILPGTGPFRFYRVAEKLVDFMPAAFFTLDGTVVSATDYHVTKRAGSDRPTAGEIGFYRRRGHRRGGCTWEWMTPRSIVCENWTCVHRRSDPQPAPYQWSKADVDAAGWGWYTDPTPLLDEEYEFDTGHVIGRPTRWPPIGTICSACSFNTSVAN